MNAPDSMYLPDVQASADRRNLAIQRVGVKSLLHPVMVASARGPQPSVASIDMYVGLPAHQKGTHMSRFIDVLQTHQQPLAMDAAKRLLDRMLARLDATTGMIEFRLPFFVLKTAPVSGVESLMDYQLTLLVERADDVTRFRQKVVVPVTSLCPCSKKVADFGAHNQRSHISITAELSEQVPVEEQIRIGIQRGEIDPEVDPEALAVVIFALMRGAVAQHLLDPERVSLERVTESVMSMLRRGILVRDEPR
jgi:GTP cyclohydrolase I